MKIAALAQWGESKTDIGAENAAVPGSTPTRGLEIVRFSDEPCQPVCLHKYTEVGTNGDVLRFLSFLFPRVAMHCYQGRDVLLLVLVILPTKIQ